MGDVAPVWLETMRQIKGVHWAPGIGPSPTISQWLQFIARNYPETAPYCGAAMHQQYFPWCGATVGYCMANAGIEPVFGSSDTKRFLWAKSWLDEGEPVSTPQPGDIVVFDFGAGDQHVTLFENDPGDGFWECLGGNQSHQVKLSKFPKNAAIGIRRPSQQGHARTQPPANSAPSRFSNCVALVLLSEGGNVDDPRDRGGRTSRGITQDDWDKWRLTRPALPPDIFQAPQDQIVAIYHDHYWDAVRGDRLPAGVDYAVFDCGVLNGVGTAAKILQTRLAVDVDGDIGKDTLAACGKTDGATLINQICDDRLRRMRALSGWATFGVGWTKRVNGVRADALKMIGAPPVVPAPAPGPSPVPQATGDDVSDQIQQMLKQLEALMSNMKDIPVQIPQPVLGSSPAAVGTLVQQALAIFQAMNGPAQAGVAAAKPTQEQIKQFSDMLLALSGVATAAPSVAKAAAGGEDLGPVNGALGQTIGNLLNGKKSAIGIVGAALTSILGAAPDGSAIGTLAGAATKLLPAFAGASPMFLPLFLAIAAWGVLGRMEKWSAGTSTGSPPPSA